MSNIKKKRLVSPCWITFNFYDLFVTQIRLIRQMIIIEHIAYSSEALFLKAISSINQTR